MKNIQSLLRKTIAVLALGLLASAAALRAQSTLNDGIPDAWRVQYFGVNFATDPAAVATADPDGDGVNNFQEYQMGTSPVDAGSKPSVPVSVSTYAGTGVAGGQDGYRTNATFMHPASVILGPDGGIYLTEGTVDGSGNVNVGAHRIRRIDTNGIVTTFAGTDTPGSMDGSAATAQFKYPADIVFDRAGNAFVAEAHGHRIRKIDTNGMVSVFAGSPGAVAGSANGTGTNAQFNLPQGLVTDADDNLYVADRGNNRIRKISPLREVTTFVTGLSTPSDISRGAEGVFYVADWGSASIKKLDTNGVASTFKAGLSYVERSVVDASGNVYALLGNTGIAPRKFYKFGPDGTQRWVISTTFGYQEGPIATAQFTHFAKPVFLANGDIVTAEDSSSRVRLIHVAVPTALSISPNGGAFTNSVTVTLSSVLTNVTVRYTVDGTMPTASSAVYGVGIVLGNSATVQARAFVSTNPVSAVISAALTVIPAVCVSAPSGLVAWWSAEGNAYDIVSGNNGQAFGTVSYASGKVGQAYIFNGSNSYVQVPSRAALKTAGAFSVEAWVYYDRLPGSSGVTIATKGVDAEAIQDWTLNIYTSGKLRPHIYVGGNWVAFNCATTLVPNTWHHVAMVYDGSTVRGYVNGVQDGSVNVSGTAQTSDNPVRIGAYAPLNGVSKNFFSGAIDELSFYSRALPASEIAGIYNAQGAGKCTLTPTLAITGQPQDQSVSVGDNVSFSVGVSGTPPMACQWRLNGTNITGATNATLVLTNVQLAQAGNYSVVVGNVAGALTSSNGTLTVTTPVCVPAPSDLVAWWSGNGSTMDAVGAHDGQIVGTLSYSAGKAGQGFSFDGTNSCVTVPHSSEWNYGTNEFTMEFWVNFRRVNATQSFLGHSSGWGSSSNKWIFWLNGGVLQFLVDGPSGGYHVISGTSFSPVLNRFHHLALVRRGNVFAIYVDGAVAGTVTNALNIPAVNTPLKIGQVEVGTFFDGTLDEVAIYNRGLLASEVKSIYNAQSAGKCALTPTLAITSQPQGQIVSVGDNVSLSVGVSGTPPVTYQWRLNGTNIASATNALLSLDSVQLAQAGDYSVVVGNVAGSVTSSNAVLTVTVPVCVPAPSGVVAWWKGEGSAYDAASTHDGMIISNISYAVGKAGQAFSFDGTNGHVSVPHSPEWDFGTNEFTMEFWVNFRRINATQSFLGHSPGWGSYIPKWIFWLNGGILQILVDGPAAPYGGHQLGNIPFSPTLNHFYHLAVARRGDVFVFYVNGAVAGTVTNSVSVPSVDAPLKIGQVEVGTFLDGVLDEVGIYNRGLSTAEIAGIYNAQSAGKCAILAAPTLVSQPQSQTMSAGGSVLFTVLATGTRPFSYQWRLNGGALAGATNASLVLPNVQTNDAGNYSVVVNNTYGTATSSNATLAVVFLGQNLFDDFDPDLDTSQWSAFGGTVLATNYGGAVSGGNALWFGGIGSRFATTRTLNTSGGGSIGYYLRLASGTNSTWERADLPGEGVVLEYSVDGGAQWTVIVTNNTTTFTAWTSQQFPIPAGAQSASTLFRWRQLSNSGTPYDHWALDDVSIQSFTNLVAPAILSGPASHAVIAGESVGFSVTAAGTAPLRYQWRFNGTDMAGATNASLTLNSVQLADAGSFSVAVSNPVGTATSSNAVLTVTSPVCVPAPSGAVAWWTAEGSTLDTVGGNNGQAFGAVAYAAGKVGQAFHFNGFNSYVQVPSSAALKTAGPFSVEAWVYYDRIPSNACAIAVKGPDGEVPLDWDFEIHSLRRLRANISVNGSWLTLTCSTTLTTNTWHHVAMVYDGSTLRCYLNGAQDGAMSVSGTVQTSDNPVRIGAYAPVNGQGSWNFFSGGIDELSLYSRALSASEVAGIYQARSAGKCGSTPSLAITSQPQGQTVTVGGNANFSVGVSGTPPIAYQWRFNGMNLAGATNATLALTSVQFAQAGDYSVVAGNIAGSVTSSNATLTVSAAVVRTGPVWLNNYDASSSAGAPIYLLNTSTRAPLDTFVQVLGGPLGGPLAPIVSESTRTNIFSLSLNSDPGFFDVGLGYVGVPDDSPAMIQVLAWRGAASYADAPVRGSVLFTNLTGHGSSGIPPSPPLPAILEMPSIVMQSTTTAAPAITLQPQGRTVIGGNSAVFGVVATGSPAVGYQWRFNGADIPGAIYANLTLPNAQSAHAGTYTVFISNSAGTVLSDPAVLTVRYLLAVMTTTGGTVTRNPASSNYALGTVVELTAAPDAGFAFTSWGDDAAGAVNPLSVTVSTNKSITAGFAENVPPVVTITSPTAGNATGSQTFLAGTVSDNVGVVSARWVRDGQPVGGLILSNGTFRVDPLALTRGTNVFRVIAADAAGNEGFAQVTVVYAPARVLAMVNPAAEQEGREITVPVELTSPGDVAGMTFVLRYDAAYLKEPEVKWASATASALEQVNLSVPGEVRATFALPAITVRAGTEEIARVTFRARSVPTNLTTALTLDVSDVSDASGNPIAGGVEVEDGSAGLLVRKLTGDNNANDRLDTGDATIIQRMLAGLEPVRSWDVTGNDLNATTTLDSGDVIKVMRTVVKLDSPPTPSASAAKSVKSVKSKAPPAVVSPVELAVVSPNGLRGQAGELVTVQVLISNVRTQLAGAEFMLDYPTNALRLVDATSHQPGGLVSGDTFALWNVLPAQTDFAAQTGRVIAGMSSGTGWPAATNGVLAQFTFRVQAGGAAQYRWPLVLSGVRLTTADGYSERPVGDAQMYFIGRNAIPANLGSGGGTAPRLNGGQFSFGLGGEAGVPYLIEVSENLRDWTPLQTVTNATGTLPFNDPGATNTTQRYYRARQLE